MNWKKLTLGAAVLATFVCVNTSWADRPAKEEFRERAPVAADKKAEQRAATEWKHRLSPGVNVWMFDDEDSEVAPALHYDFWNTDTPLNYRVGVEGAHLDLEQDNAAGLADGPGREPRVTFVRIPFAVEYRHALGDALTWYIGGGPDLNIFANDASDTQVGGHLGTRLGWNFDEHWGISVDAGYMWANIDESETGDVNLDGAYISPLMNYTF